MAWLSYGVPSPQLRTARALELLAKILTERHREDPVVPVSKSKNMVRLLSLKEASEVLGVSEEGLWRWKAEGKIKFVQCGRLVKIDVKDLEEWILNNKSREEWRR